MGRNTQLPTDLHLEKLLEELKKSHLRVTEPRIAILRVLLEEHGPFTAEEIHKCIPKKMCDLATIYRTLASLEKTGIIRRCEFGDGSARYELSEHENHHHHHVICKVCKAVEVLDDCELNELAQYAQKRGFTEVTHSLEFFGVCPNCQQKK